MAQPSILASLFADSFDNTVTRKRSSLEKDLRIQEIIAALVERGASREDLAVENVNAALESNYANGDVHRTIDLLSAFHEAIDGKIKGIAENDGNTSEMKYHKLLGADNRNQVTCYLDTLLFAMFSRLESFEPMIEKKPYEKDSPIDPNKDNLAVILRLYVNLMRTGQLITTDITKILLGSILKAGWDESCFEKQQDCCDLFNFITDKLDMPMITLKLDIAHEGKEDKKDDHKLVNERLLLVSVPAGDEPVLLEQCLEHYFANSIQVSRQIERRRTLSSSSSLTGAKRSRRFSVCIHSPELSSSSRPLSKRSSSLDGNVINGCDPEEEDMEAVLSKYQTYATLRSPLSNASDSASVSASLSDRPPAYNSIYGSSGNTIPEKSSLSSASPNTPNALWNRNMAITLPAWMFLQLVPFYTNSSAAPCANESHGKSLPTPHATDQFATTRPVLGICLKRSEWSADNQSMLNTRRVMIPSVIHFPSFVADDDDDKSSEGLVSEKYVLVLESAIFHRGNSTESGHFVALAKENNSVRYHNQSEEGDITTTPTINTSLPPITFPPFISTNPTNTTTSSVDDLEPSIDDDTHLHTRWLLFDDLRPAGQKVQRVDYNEVFEKEKPYILFYRLVTVEDFENESERHKDGRHCKSTVEPRGSVPNSMESLETSEGTEFPPELTQGDSSTNSISTYSSFYKLKPSLGFRTKSATATFTKSSQIARDDPKILASSRSSSPVPQVRHSLDEVSIHHIEMRSGIQLPFVPTDESEQAREKEEGIPLFRRNKASRHLKQKQKGLRSIADDYRDEKCIIS